MNWPVLKALHEIYVKGETPKKEALLADSKVRFLLTQTRELTLGIKKIFKGEGYQAYYENNLLGNFLSYECFLTESGLLKPQLRYQEADIRILMDIYEGMKSGELVPVRDAIIKAEETVRGVSEMFFKNEKYLESSDSLVRDVKILLGISELANDKDQQYMYILQVDNPAKIVLCENLDFLKRPSRPRKHRIELWYAGGKNIEKLNYIGDITLPIYYSCDWDHDGLMIYQLVKQKIPEIKLLFPNGQRKNIKETEHKSIWNWPDSPSRLSGLDPTLFNEHEKKLIEELIRDGQWIIEEKNDLVAMLQTTNQTC